MSTDDKLTNAIIDLGMAIKELRGEVKELRKDVNELGHEIQLLQKNQQRTNVELSEIRLTFMQYAGAIEKYPQLEKRVLRLEKMAGK